MTDEQKKLLSTIPCFKQFAQSGEVFRLGFSDIFGDLVVITGENLQIEKVKKKRVEKDEKESL